MVQNWPHDTINTYLRSVHNYEIFMFNIFYLVFM